MPRCSITYQLNGARNQFASDFEIGGLPMLKNILPIAAAGALSLFAATGFASADDSHATNLGPVGPYQPILAKVGDSRLLAYYEPDQGKCAVSAVMSTAAADGAVDAKRVRVSLHPGELFHLDGVNNERVVFTCAPDAKAMTVLNKGEVLTRQASNVVY
ncbi:hypothetical protein AUC70_05420 [Methyloceanibacter stevinii]|uniref:Uncharacterized protein n=2 Tax=Methyloceanibacter stevinii TaxID=1774970 RepID=A0A1E3VNQ3_9HYPH|nr:hypothetical protein AUC70_05420 [Methyloceanibacter stevinii]